MLEIKVSLKEEKRKLMKTNLLFTIMLVSYCFSINGQITFQKILCDGNNFQGLNTIKGEQPLSLPNGKMNFEFMPSIKRRPENIMSSLNLPDSAYNWQWDTLSNNWIVQSKTLYWYDGNNNLLNGLRQNRDSIIWLNYSQWNSTYDVNNNQTNSLYQLWNGSNWENYEQRFSTYDTSNNRTSDLRQLWDTSVWVNDYQYLYTYDVNNNQIVFVNQCIR